KGLPLLRAQLIELLKAIKPKSHSHIDTMCCGTFWLFMPVQREGLLKRSPHVLPDFGCRTDSLSRFFE
ncbi:hypothetical protein, partial [Pseudocitrobacter faecalis]|uniref:hypothetical protein n=1 Tax=Pseudocitrobacter faecalis TaxID=1398493 RepID=UPI001ABFBF59